MEEKNIQAEVVNETNEDAKTLDTIKAKAAGFWAKNKKKILIGAGVTAAAVIVYALCKAASNGDSINSIESLDVRPRDDFDDGEMRRLLWEERGLEAKYQKACDLINNVGKELDLAPDERFWFTGIVQGDNYSVTGTEEPGVGGWFEIDGSDISRPRDLT